MKLSLVEKIVAIATELEQAQVQWAIGGAVALAYATEEPRATRDIDLNVFVSSDVSRTVFNALPEGVRFNERDIEAVENDGQVRLWWDDTPIDLFFSVSSFHDDVGRRCQVVPFSGQSIRILAAEDLAVFKAMFDRPKDWIDIATMVEAGRLDTEVASQRLLLLLGDDPRVVRLRHGGAVR